MRNQTILNACAGAMVAWASLATIGAERDVINKSFSVKAGETLYIRVDRGSINVLTSNSDKVEVKVVREVKRESDAEARALYEQHKIEIAQEGGIIRVEAENAQTGGGFFKKAFKNPFQNLHVEYTVSVPAEFDLDLRTASGNIDVEDLQGDIAVHTSGGHIKLGSMRGPVKAHTSGGNVDLSEAKGKVNLHTSGGHLRIGKIEGDLVAKTSGGNISLAQINGDVEASTSGGHIQLKKVHGTMKARTSGGNISVNLAAQPAADCSLRTSGGHLTLILAEKLAVNINARTSGGRVQSDFPGELNKQRNRLTAEVNGGGPEIVLETSGGNIQVRAE